MSCAVRRLRLGLVGGLLGATTGCAESCAPQVAPTPPPLPFVIAGCKPYLAAPRPACVPRAAEVRLWFDVDRYALLRATLDERAVGDWTLTEDGWQLTLSGRGRLRVLDPQSTQQMELDLVAAPPAPRPPPAQLPATLDLDLATRLLHYGNPTETSSTSAEVKLEWLALAEEAFSRLGRGYEAAVARERRLYLLADLGRASEARHFLDQRLPETPALEGPLFLAYARTQVLLHLGEYQPALQAGLKALRLAERARHSKVIVLLLGPLLDVIVRTQEPARSAHYGRRLLNLARSLPPDMRAYALLTLGWQAFLTHERAPDRVLPEGLDARALTQAALDLMADGDRGRPVAWTNLGLAAAMRGDRAQLDAALREVPAAALSPRLRRWRALLELHALRLSGTCEADWPIVDSARAATAKHELDWRSEMVRAQIERACARPVTALAHLDRALMAAERWVVEVARGAQARHLSHYADRPTRAAIELLTARGQHREAFAWARRGRRVAYAAWSGSASSRLAEAPPPGVAWALLQATEDERLLGFVQLGSQVRVAPVDRHYDPTLQLQAVLTAHRRHLAHVHQIRVLTTPETRDFSAVALRSPTRPDRPLFETHLVTVGLDAGDGLRTPRATGTLLVADLERVPGVRRAVRGFVTRARDGAPPLRVWSSTAAPVRADFGGRLVFVGHGRPGKDLQEAGLALPGGRWLTASSIARWKVAPERAVLLACHSGGDAEATLGFGHALILAGAREVLVSRRTLSVDAASAWLDALPVEGPLADGWASAVRELSRAGHSAEDLGGVVVLAR